MKKEITRENKEKIQKLLSATEGAKNNVPFKLKTVFNFKGRKSPKIAQKIIEAITDEDDIIFDPFMGSGSFVIAAAKANRKIVATEIDNYTYSAVYAMLVRVDLKKLNKLFNKIEESVKLPVMNLYETYCCKVKNYIEKLYFDPKNNEFYSPRPNREFSDNKNIKLISPCPICKNKYKVFEKFDETKVNSVSKDDVADFPKDAYIENSRINITKSAGANRYDRIFTKRNQKAMLMIQKEILKHKPCIERDVIEQALVSALSLARISMYGSSTDILYHVVPFGAQEMNVWTIFEAKFNSFVSFKKEYADILFEKGEKDKKYCIFNESYQDFCSEKLLKETYDLIYTDFPYTDQVPYLERNQLYRVWLNKFYDKNNFKLTAKMLDEEIVQSDSPSRKNKRDIGQYYSDIDKMFKAFYRVLKKNSLAVFTVKLGKAKYFTTLTEIINLARKNGFEYAFRVGTDKNDPTIRKQAAYKNTLSKEMIIGFQKLDEDERYWYIGNKNYEFETVKTVYNAIEKKELTITKAVALAEKEILQKEAHIASENERLIIRNIIFNNFVTDANTSIIRKDYNKLYLDIEDNTDLFTKFYNLIPVIIKRLLDEKGSFVLDDLYFEIANTLCSGDPKTVNQFLEDRTHSSGIDALVKNYCETDGQVYTKKNFSYAANDDATDISTLEGYEFEKLVKKLLEADGYFNVVNIGGAGDLGVDLLAEKYDEEKCIKLYLFQCKRWTANVGSEPMQRLVAERLRRAADAAVCVTTSDFTKDGQLISNEQDISMWNGEYITRKLNEYFPGQYYNGALKQSIAE